MFKNFIISLLIVTNIITATFCFRLNSKLGQYMAKCEHYRLELEAATDRQSEITEVVGHTSCILSETVNSVAELREQLKAVEDDYNRLYSLCFDNRDIIHNGEKQMNSINTYVTVASYFQDMTIIENRLERLEHIIDNLTKYQVEMLNNKETKDGDKNSKIRSK